MGEKGKQRVGLCYCSTAVAAAAAAAHITAIPNTLAATPPPVPAVVVVMLLLSAFICTCPAVRLGSPRLCSPAQVRACPTIHALVLPFVWAAPIHAHRPSFVLVPLF